MNNNFENLTQLEHLWLNNKFDYPPEMMVAGIMYRPYKSSENTFSDYINEGQHGFITYHTSDTHKSEAQQAGLEQWIVFVWETTGNTIVPKLAKSVKPHRFIHYIQHESENISSNQQLDETEVIGDVVVLRIDLPSGSGAIKGKVDTGAEVCSLHADQMKISDGHVKFINQELSNNVITAPLSEKQAVKSSDGGVEYRPVIILDVVINDKPVKKVQFNLNDRSEMEYKCLVGMNLLEKTGFMINPSQDEVPHGEMRDGDNMIEDVWLSDEQLQEATINFQELSKYFTEHK